MAGLRLHLHFTEHAPEINYDFITAWKTSSIQTPVNECTNITADRGHNNVCKFIITSAVKRTPHV